MDVSIVLNFRSFDGKHCCLSQRIWRRFKFDSIKRIGESVDLPLNQLLSLILNCNRCKWFSTLYLILTSLRWRNYVHHLREKGEKETLMSSAGKKWKNNFGQSKWRRWEFVSETVLDRRAPRADNIRGASLINNCVISTLNCLITSITDELNHPAIILNAV